MNRILISFSGGRTSAYMAYWMLNEWADRHLHEMIVVFANTGKERTETLAFVDQCDKTFNLNLVWIESEMQEHGKGASFRVVNFETASTDGSPFEGVIAKHGIPNSAFPHCSRELKARPIRAYAKSIGWSDYKTAIGIRADEPKRINWEKAERENILWPLVSDNPTSRYDIAYFWNRMPFDLPISSYQGNCDLCWKKSRRKLLTILRESPDKSDWWQRMEDLYGRYVPVTRPTFDKVKLPLVFYRGNESVAELLEESKLPFSRALDESKEENRLKLMREWNREYDESDGCSESCEVF